MGQMVCGSCRELIAYPRGAVHVRCAGCQTINLVLEGAHYLYFAQQFLFSLFFLTFILFPYYKFQSYLVDEQNVSLVSV
jgi:LSD1 subclass zinc finger protein